MTDPQTPLMKALAAIDLRRTLDDTSHAEIAYLRGQVEALRAENAELLLEVAPLRAARARFADIDECLSIPVGEYPEIPQSAAPAIPPAGVGPAVRREAGQPTSDGHSNPQ